MISIKSTQRKYKRKRLLNSKEENYNNINKFNKIELGIYKNGNKDILKPITNKSFKYGTISEKIDFLNNKLYKTIL